MKQLCRTCSYLGSGRECGVWWWPPEHETLPEQSESRSGVITPVLTELSSCQCAVCLCGRGAVSTLPEMTLVLSSELGVCGHSAQRRCGCDQDSLLQASMPDWLAVIALSSCADMCVRVQSHL
jgi:hypothetical protein